MAATPKTVDGVANVFRLLGLPVPDQTRLQRIASDPRSYTEIRNALLWTIANADPNDNITTDREALASVLDQQFAAAGLQDAGTGSETEQQRIDRIVSEILSGQRTLGEVSQTIAGFGTGGSGDGGSGDDGKLTPGPVTDVPPVQVGSSTIPQGGSLIRVNAPLASDAAYLYYIVYDWRGVKLTFEVGDQARFKELFGSTDNFDSFTSVSQDQFDSANYVQVGLIDQELGATESIGSRIERDVRALGLEDLPPWLASSQEALALVAEASAQQWSAGRLWTQLSDTQAFGDRFGDVIDRYLQAGSTISQAVAQIQADEQQMKAALLFAAPGDSLTIDTIHQMLSQGWTPESASRVLEAADVLKGGSALAQANEILDAVGLPSLDEVGFINALKGHGPPDVVEALNTIAAGQALSDAGLGDVDTNLLMDVVSTSDRILTVDSFRELAQQLSFNLAKFGTEVDRNKLGVTEEDIIAGIFGRESPTGRSAGESMNLLLRFERDRQAAAQGLPGTQAALDQRGRLRVAGLAGL